MLLCHLITLQTNIRLKVKQVADYDLYIIRLSIHRYWNESDHLRTTISELHLYTDFPTPTLLLPSQSSNYGVSSKHSAIISNSAFLKSSTKTLNIMQITKVLFTLLLSSSSVSALTLPEAVLESRQTCTRTYSWYGDNNSCRSDWSNNCYSQCKYEIGSKPCCSGVTGSEIRTSSSCWPGYRKCYCQCKAYNA